MKIFVLYSHCHLAGTISKGKAVAGRREWIGSLFDYWYKLDLSSLSPRERQFEAAAAITVASFHVAFYNSSIDNDMGCQWIQLSGKVLEDALEDPLYHEESMSFLRRWWTYLNVICAINEDRLGMDRIPEILPPGSESQFIRHFGFGRQTLLRAIGVANFTQECGGMRQHRKHNNGTWCLPKDDSYFEVKARSLIRNLCERLIWDPRIMAGRLNTLSALERADAAYCAALAMFIYNRVLHGNCRQPPFECTPRLLKRLLRNGVGENLWYCSLFPLYMMWTSSPKTKLTDRDRELISRLSVSGFRQVGLLFSILKHDFS